MRRYQTVDVFTDRRFAGNPLAVVLDGEGLADATMQAIAREFGYSETTFVCRPGAPGTDATVRIFTPVAEVPFAGHPNIGTAFVLAAAADAPPDRYVFDEKAGPVPVTVRTDGGRVVGAELTAPEALSLAGQFDPAVVAAGVGLAAGDLRTDGHAPVVASVGLPFLVVELASRSALARARPDPVSIGAVLPAEGADGIYLYTRDVGAADGEVDVTARMFAPWDGVVEDPATGSATAAAAALMATLGAPPDGPVRRRFAQGVDMGRPSRLDSVVAFTGGQITAVRIAGTCVPVMNGTLDV